MTFEEVKHLVREGKYFFSAHAGEERTKDELSEEEVIESVLSGEVIREYGLSVAEQLVQLRDTNNYDYVIIGVGGVMSLRDFYAYLAKGVDVVQSCTGAWINPDLAIKIRSAQSEDKTGATRGGDKDWCRAYSSTSATS